MSADVLQTINEKFKALLAGFKLDPRVALGVMAGVAALLAICVDMLFERWSRWLHRWQQRSVE